jgi:hypothetical protein
MAGAAAMAAPPMPSVSVMEESPVLQKGGFNKVVLNSKHRAERRKRRATAKFESLEVVSTKSC